jgi:hypothetical protein
MRYQYAMNVSRRSAVLGIGFVVVAVVAVLVAMFHGGKSGSMSKADARKLHIGETRTAVEKAVGKPMDSVNILSLPNAPSGRDCVYYNAGDDADRDDSRLYRLCYLNGKLDSMATITSGGADGGGAAVSGI